MTRTATHLEELRAEYELLRLYDRRRELAGYDYGSGQRGAELMRRRHELDRLDPEWFRMPPVQLDELAPAFEKIGRPRLERSREYGDPEVSYNGRTTKSSRATFRTWRELERMVTR